MTPERLRKKSEARDYLTEMMTGQEASVKVISKVVLMPQHRIPDTDYERTAIFGTVLSRGPLILPENSGHHEMCEGELILMPRGKYSATNKEGKVMYEFNGWRADQILCYDFGNPENWARKYWELKS